MDRGLTQQTLAGRLACGRGAPAVGADLLERAAAGEDRVDVRSGMLTEAAEAAVAAGDPDRAVAALHVVLDIVPAGRRRAEALLALGEIAYVERPNDAQPLLVAALAHTEGDASLLARVHSYIAGMADMDPALANRSADLAAEILERESAPDPDHLACALLDRAFHALLRGEPIAADDIERALRLRRGAGDSFVSRRAQEVAERCLFYLGRLDEARAIDEAEYRRLTERGQFGLLPPMAQALSALTQLSGDWTAARRYAEECADLVEQGEHAWRDRAMLAGARIRAWDGDLHGARAIAVPALARQEAAGDRWEAAIFCALLGFAELSAPDPPAALGYMTRALGHADAIEVVLPTQFRFLGDLVEAAVLAGDPELAERVLADRLEAAADRQPLPWTVAMARRGRGLVAAARGDLDAAIACYDSALAVFDTALAMPFEHGRTRYGRGRVHRRAGHRRAARDDLAAAVATFESLGATAWSAQARHESGRLGGRAPNDSALTTAERTVARLAASGRTNREIADELQVSVRTVESQLSTVYRKVGVRSRGRLAYALAAGPDPTSPEDG
jgi:DNA-binding CsgD family transcriptional regulator